MLASMGAIAGLCEHQLVVVRAYGDELVLMLVSEVGASFIEVARPETPLLTVG
jgi:hypothetical protein